MVLADCKQAFVGLAAILCISIYFLLLHIIIEIPRIQNSDVSHKGETFCLSHKANDKYHIWLVNFNNRSDVLTQLKSHFGHCFEMSFKYAMALVNSAYQTLCGGYILNKILKLPVSIRTRHSDP